MIIDAENTVTHITVNKKGHVCFTIRRDGEEAILEFPDEKTMTRFINGIIKAGENGFLQ